MNGEGRPGGGTETAQEPAKAKASLGQIPPVGPVPTADVCLVGALMYCSPADAAGVVSLVLDDDLESPALAAVLGAIRRLVEAGRPSGPQVVLDELRRTGNLKSLVVDQLCTATTCGAASASAGDYACAVVAESLRRRIAAAGDALTVTAWWAAESSLAPLVTRAAESIGSCASRLATLRGEPL